MSRDRTDSRSSAPTDERHTDTSPPGDSLASGGVENVADSGSVTVSQAQYELDGSRDLTTVIISAIADAEDMPMTSIKNPPLYEVVDIAAVNSALFDQSGVDVTASNRFFEFCYRQYSVRIEATGWVKVRDRVAERVDDR